MPLHDWLMRFWNVRVLLIALLLQLLFLDSLSAKVHSPHILILNSYHDGYAGTDDIIQGFRRSITEKFPGAKFQVEYLDSKNHSGSAYDESLFQLLAYKYKDHHLDLIFASDDYAYNLVEKKHASLFPDLPVVFCGTNSFEIGRLEGKDQFVGVDERPSFKETVGLIFKLLPATKKVIVIHDGSITGKLNSKAFRTETSDFEKQADFIYWVEQPLEGLLKKIRNLPANAAIVYFASYVKDSSGAVHASSDALEILSAASPVPLFGGWEFSLNHGIIGGKLINLSEHGALAGQIATKMLAGEKSGSNSKLFPSPNIYMFDDNELKRFAIADSKLPKGSTIINRPPSFYQQNKTTIFASLASILGFLAIVSFIAIYTSRRRLNTAYQKQLMVEKALQKEMTFSTSLINTAQLIILVMDVKGRIQMMNPYMETITGYKEAEVKGKDWFDTFLLPADHTELRTMFKNAIANIDVSGEANPIMTKDGQELMIEWHSKTLKDDNGTVIGLLSFGIDIAERIQAEQELKKSENKFRVLLNNQNDAVFLHEVVPDGYTIFFEVNEKAVKHYGYSREEFLQLSPQDISRIDDSLEHLHSTAKKQLISQGHAFFEITHIKKSGEEFPVEVNASLIELDDKTYILSTVRDISERKQAGEKHLELEEQLRQKHKMEAVGYMAGGMAHNFNNNLGIILGNVELSQMKQPHGSEVIHLLENAKIAIRNSRDLILKIITYSRKGMQSTIVTQLTPIIKETSSLLLSTLPTTISLQQNINPDCSSALVDADPSQIQEILVNLCNNAVHAMDGKGELQISLEPVELREKDIHAQYDATPGSYAKLSVQDTGCGMPNEMLDKIFDPFYTTKEDYEGAGMGLSTVQCVFQ